EERWANLLELREVTTRYDDLSPEDALDRLLEETALVADQDSYQSDADMLSLITLHAAKGLEFEVVFIAGLEESLFPTGRAVEAEGGFNPDPRPMEEERRLAYVGMTRARSRLYLSHAWQRATRRDAFAAGARSGTFGRRPVQAWDDAADAGEAPDDKNGSGGGAAPAPRVIDRPVIPGERRYRDGDRIRHARWGDGIVVSSKLTSSDEEVTIAFRDPLIGRKTLLASLAGLELVG